LYGGLNDTIRVDERLVAPRDTRWLACASTHGSDCVRANPGRAGLAADVLCGCRVRWPLWR